MSASDDAYRAAVEAIAEAKRAGALELSFDSKEFRALDRVPPEIAELTGLAHLDLAYTLVSDLAPLSALTELQSMNLSDTQVSDLTPLAALKRLHSITLDYTRVRDLTPLVGLVGLDTLDLNDTHVSDLTPLAALTGLQNLFLNYTPVSDLTPLAALVGLETVYLDYTQISDLSPLVALTGLKELSFANTQISDLKPLAALTGLEGLYFEKTKVSDLTPLLALTQLQNLILNNTQVSDLTPLAVLTELRTLGVDITQVSDLAILTSFKRLRQLDLNNSQVTDLRFLVSLTGLEGLNLNNTEVSDLSPVAALTGLHSLHLYNTQVSDLTPLAALTSLERLTLSETQVSDLRPLKKLASLRRAFLGSIHFENIPACADPEIAEIAAIEDDEERVRALFALLDEGWQPPTQAKEPPPEPDLDELLQGPILSDALADVEKGEERFEATSIDSGPERTPDKRYRQMIETLAYAARRLGGTATENRIGRDLAESFRDYAECLGVDPPNPRMLNYIGQSIGGVMQDDDALASLDGFDKERIGGFLAENENLIRGYFPSARKAAEFDSETDPEILAKELLPKIAGVREITIQANEDGLFASSVVTALDVLNRRAEGAIKVYATTDNDKARESAIKELRRASVLVTAFVGRIKGRLVQWLKAQGAYVRENPYTTFAANVTVLSSYPAAYANTITLATSVVAKITPFFEALWQLVGKIPLPF